VQVGAVLSAAENCMGSGVQWDQAEEEQHGQGGWFTVCHRPTGCTHALLLAQLLCPARPALHPTSVTEPRLPTST